MTAEPRRDRAGGWSLRARPGHLRTLHGECRPRIGGRRGFVSAWVDRRSVHSSGSVSACRSSSSTARRAAASTGSASSGARSPGYRTRCRCRTSGGTRSNGTYLYFDHSFAAHPSDHGTVTGWCEHGERFAAWVEDGPVTGRPVPPREERDERDRDLEEVGRETHELHRLSGGRHLRGTLRSSPAGSVRDRDRLLGRSREGRARLLRVRGPAGCTSSISTVPRRGIPANRELVLEVVRAASCPVQAGGGLRTLDDVEEVIAAGANRAVLGTVALEDPDALAKACARYGERIAVSLDAKGGELASHGWTVGTGVPLLEAVKAFEAAGVAHFIYTDVGSRRDHGGARHRGSAPADGGDRSPGGRVGRDRELEELKTVARLRPRGRRGRDRGPGPLRAQVHRRRGDARGGRSGCGPRRTSLVEPRQ